MVRGFKRSQLGINLGDNAITIIESSSKEMIRHCRQDFSSFGASLADIAEDEIKFAAVLQKILRENELSSRDAYIGLPASDVIIRFFQIPALPNAEIPTTVNFEARKYIPFRIEELVFDYIARKKGKNLDIIFCAIKKKVLDKYLKALNQVGFNVISFEPSSLSFLRAILVKVRFDVRQTTMVVDIDAGLSEGDIMILESGIPCFIRDIKLSAQAETPQTTDNALALNKLINEIRISIDYFRHRQPSMSGNIATISLYSQTPATNPWAELITSELGIKCVGFSLSEILAVDGVSLELLKAAGASFRGSFKFPTDLNLLKKEEKSKKETPSLASVGKAFISKVFFKKIATSVSLAIAAVVIFSFLSGQRIKLLEGELNRLNLAKQKLVFLPKAIDIDEKGLSQIKSLLSVDLKEIGDRIENRMYITDKIERIAALLPDGVWLDGLSYRKDTSGVELALEAVAYLPESENPLTVINAFLNNLRSDKRFSYGFKDVALESVRQSVIDNFNVRIFQVKCR